MGRLILRLRHEAKHQISPQEDLVLASRLRKLFPWDSHTGPDGSYRVTSLYFDTLYDAALQEKLDGVDRREKFRLRYYWERPDFLQLEKKHKVNGLCGKRSTCLTLDEAERLLSGEDAFLLLLWCSRPPQGREHTKELGQQKRSGLP